MADDDLLYGGWSTESGNGGYGSNNNDSYYQDIMNWDSGSQQNSTTPTPTPSPSDCFDNYIGQQAVANSYNVASLGDLGICVASEGSSFNIGSSVYTFSGQSYIYSPSGDLISQSANGYQINTTTGTIDPLP
jgi:hypothetical protein